MEHVEFILFLRDLYTEKRSDVVDIIDKYLTTGNAEDYSEQRFIQATIPGTNIEVEYDTLTTLMSYHTPLEQWKDCENHKYLGD
jgi:hypothetical protein